MHRREVCLHPHRRLVLLHDAAQSQDQRKLIAAGLLLGLAALFKELGLPLALALAAWLTRHTWRTHRPRSGQTCLTFLLAVFLPLAPWTVRNLHHYAPPHTAPTANHPNRPPTPPDNDHNRPDNNADRTASNRANFDNRTASNRDNDDDRTASYHDRTASDHDRTASDDDRTAGGSRAAGRDHHN